MFDFGVIDHWAKNRPQDIAYIDESHALTFVELDKHIRKISSFLMMKGVAPQDLIALSLPPYLNFLFSLSLHGLGATVLSTYNLRSFGKGIEPNWFLGFENHPSVPADRTIICDITVQKIISESAEIQTFPYSVKPNDLARLFSTSGTTGGNKYIAVSYGDLEFYIEREGSSDLFGEAPLLSLYPFGAGQTFRTALKALRAGKPYISCAFNDWRLPKLLKQHSIRTLIGSPAQISNFLEIQRQTGTELNSLKIIIMGGSAISSKLVLNIRSQLDCRIVNAYGSTEANNIAYQIIGEDVTNELTINGKGSLEVVDDHDQPQPKNVIGRVRFQTPGMANSYYRNPEATEEFFKSGYFYPGDFGLINGNNKLVLAGRISETINFGGVKVDPNIIDDLAIGQLGVIDCAAFAAGDASGVEQAVIAVVVNKDFEEIFFRQVIAKKSPLPILDIVFVEKIPRNQNGKINRNLLRENFESRP
jgi:acyl-coenzyme A synthetase/AMP-(fatty) acid ligase